jgi:hypothetical protein
MGKASDHFVLLRYVAADVRRLHLNR